MKFLKTYFIRYRRDIFLGQACKFIEAALELYLPLVMAKLIDALGGGERALPVLREQTLIMLLIALVGVLTALVCQYVASRASQNFGTELRRDLFTRALSLSSPEFSRIGAASLTTREINDVNQLQQALAMLIRLVVRAPFLAVGSIVMAALLDVHLALVFLVTTPLIALTMYLVMRAALPRYAGLQRGLDRLTSAAREALLGARVMRAFSRQAREEARFDAEADRYAAAVRSAGRLSALLTPVTMIVMNFGVLAVLWLGGARAQQGALSQGVVIAFINYLAQILLQTAVVANLVTIFTRAGAAARRVGEVLSLTPSIGDGAGAAPDFSAPAVEFCDVAFTYPGGGAPALKHITFSLRAGATMGVIGGTGAGKSTLLKLLPRLFDADSGSVRVFGRDARAYALARLRSLIGYVPQNASLSRGSVADNLRWGDPRATDGEMRAALKTAQAADFVGKFKDGLDHPLAEGAANLSGGQKQRLNIARALVRRPKILLLDDCASALDYLTDLNLRRAIARDLDGVAVIIVSQRAAAVRACDGILVLDDGEIAGYGAHDDLMRDCAVYREIVLSQQEGGGDE